MANEGKMKRLKTGTGVIRSLIVGILAGGLGILAGGLGTIYLDLSENVKQMTVKQRDWLSDDLYEAPCRWCYMKVDEKGWIKQHFFCKFFFCLN